MPLMFRLWRQALKGLHACLLRRRRQQQLGRN
jgi:hypothetical protein